MVQTLHQTKRSMKDDQREAMFNAWRRQQDEKEKQCKHKWCYVTPYYCLRCGKLKDQ